MLLRLSFHIYCDRCGRQFTVEMDDPPLQQSVRLETLAATAVAESQTASGGFAEIVGSQTLCVACAFHDANEKMLAVADALEDVLA